MNITPLVTVYTCVYNSKEYTEQCIQSVLNQTYCNIQYIIVDNCSTDGATDVVRKYADLDNRIEAYYMDENLPGRFLEFVGKYAKGDYVTSLDCDDYIELDYIDKLVNFAVKEELDISISGSCFHYMSNGTVGYRKLDRSIIYYNDDIINNLHILYQFLRTIWGKLYKRELLNYCNTHQINEIAKSRYGVDTAICLEMANHSKSIGVLEDVLHNYRVHSSSISSKYNPYRFNADLILYEEGMKFVNLNNTISILNNIFIKRVYFNAICDTINTLIKSSITDNIKTDELTKIIGHEYTLEVIKTLYSGYDLVKSFIKSITGILASLKADFNSEPLITYLYDILISIEPKCSKWLIKKDIAIISSSNTIMDFFLNQEFKSIFYLVSNETIKYNITDCIKFLSRLLISLDINANEKLEWFTALFKNDYILLVKEQFAMFCRENTILYNVEDNEFFINEIEIITAILKGNYVEAMELLLYTIETKDIFIDHISLSQLISAILENHELYIYSQKLELFYYIDENNLDKIKFKLNELIEILPDDEDIKMYYKKFEN